jgi:hypothetical protein
LKGQVKQKRERVWPHPVASLVLVLLSPGTGVQRTGWYDLLHTNTTEPEYVNEDALDNADSGDAQLASLQSGSTCTAFLK